MAAAAPEVEVVPEGSGPIVGLTGPQITQFIQEGYLRLKSSLPPSFHADIFRKVDALNVKRKNPGNNILSALPVLNDFLQDPAVRGALESILGPGYVLHPHRYCHARDSKNKIPQQFHKDSYWGYNQIRCHEPRWVMLMYYPQQTTPDLSPTEILPQSQYLCHRSEEWNLTGWNPMRDIPDRWGLSDPVACVGDPGDFVLIHYDLVHRGTAHLHPKEVRYMFKFQFTRTVEPALCPPPDPPLGTSPFTDHPLACVHTFVWQWLTARLVAEGDVQEDEIDDLPGAGTDPVGPALKSEAPADEVNRLATAYAAAHVAGGVDRLCEALVKRNPQGKSGNVSRCAMYGLVAGGWSAVPSLLEVLGRDITPHVAGRIYWILGEIVSAGMARGPASAAHLETIVTATLDGMGHKDPKVRRCAVETAGLVGQVPWLTPELQQSLCQQCVDMFVAPAEEDHVRGTAGLAVIRLLPVAKVIKVDLTPIEALPESANERYIRGYAWLVLERAGMCDVPDVPRWCALTTPGSPY